MACLQSKPFFSYIVPAFTVLLLSSHISLFFVLFEMKLWGNNRDWTDINIESIWYAVWLSFGYQVWIYLLGCWMIVLETTDLLNFAKLARSARLFQLFKAGLTWIIGVSLASPDTIGIFRYGTVVNYVEIVANFWSLARFWVQSGGFILIDSPKIILQ